ncbi:MAG: helix-turn-helix domain-containing protein [Treponema sp.]|nr:helix-turn-helix domain-containing protein [Treponema sp.]
MLRPYDLLKNVLLDIEKGIKKGISAPDLAKKHKITERHLRRLFQFSFKLTISGYIRSRKLAASLDDLLKPEETILNIALKYGFDYEQSYIRAFKREFGLTPGGLRKTGRVVKVKPPIHLFNENKLPDGILFGPDIVMVPQFHFIGKPSRIPFSAPHELAPNLAKEFWHNERSLIESIADSNVYIGFTSKIDRETASSEYMPSVPVKNLKYIPPGLNGYTFDSSLCARFRYIGQHHYYDISSHVAGAMYNAIRKFEQDGYVSSEPTKYVLQNNRVHFEKIDIGLYDGTYCQMEWFSPVLEKEGL